MDILKLGPSDIVNAVSGKKVKAQEVYEAFWKQAQKQNERLNAFITFNEKGLEKASDIDKQIAQGKSPGKLAGVPMAIKDMLCTEGLRTTAGSKILENFIPPYSSTVVLKLEGAGAVTMGKTNQDEFAMGSSNENSFFGKCKNPWNLEYVPGGSSGGSAAAVSALMSAASIGTDTGGSIRQPAHFCGLVGVKPTYGRVSRYGIIAFASSLDQAGPFSRTVKDGALITEVISGKDINDATTASDSVPEFSKLLSTNLKGIKIGIPKEYLPADLNADVRKSVEDAKSALKAAGAEFVEVSLKMMEAAVPVYYLVATSEASSNLARYDGVRFGYRSDFSKKPTDSLEDFFSRNRGEAFGPEVKRRIIMGTYCLSSGYYDAYYKKAGQVRELLKREFGEAFKKCDVLLAPVANSPAFKIGERIEDPLSMYLNDIYTTSANLAGIPAMTVPVSVTSGGLPLGVQIMAKHFDEQTMFNVGYALEQNIKKEFIPNVR